MGRRGYPLEFRRKVLDLVWSYPVSWTRWLCGGCR
jgi:hypothetical protein